MKLLAPIVVAFQLACLIGCSPVTIRGTVIEGELSTIAVISSSDPRFDEPGIAGAEVTIMQTGRTGDVISRTSNKDGKVALPLKGTGALSRPMRVEVRAPGYLPAVIEQMPTPTSGQRLLVLLEPIRARDP